MLRLSVVLLLVPSLAHAGPGTLLHQGRVLDPAGGAVNGTQNVVLGLYTQASGGTAVCSETQSVVLSDGYYSAVLGDGACDLTTLDFNATTYWVQTQVGTTTLFPRNELHAAPMALSAAGGTSNPDGLVPPTLTTAQRDAVTDAVAGQIIYNGTQQELQMYTGTTWVRIGTDASIVSTSRLFIGWGRGSNGELGNGSTTGTNAYPTQLPFAGSVKALSAGGYIHGGNGATCLIDGEDDLYCTGRYEFVPDGTTTQRDTFTGGGGIGLVWRDVFVGTNRVACGVTEDNTAYCWGHQQYGGLGDGQNVNAVVSSPRLVLGGSVWKEVRPGGRYDGSRYAAFSCAVSTATTGDNGYCWGRDDWGVLGNGDARSDHNYNGPVAANRLSGFTWDTIRPSAYHVCGLTTAGQALCWGEGGSGRLGTGSTTDRDVPTPVAGGHTFTSIAIGEQHGCGLTPEGEAWCWGDNGNSQLGDGTTTDRTSPVRVVGGLRWLSLDAGQHHTCGIDTSHRMWCWGYNGNGGIGDGSTSNRNVPTPVYGEYRFETVEVGYRHSLGITQ